MNDENTQVGVLAREIIDAFPNIIDGSSYVTTNTAISSIGASTISASTINPVSTSVEDVLDQYIMNRVTVDHKVTAQELLKLKEVAPDYASEIKEGIADNLTREIAKKISYTKKYNKDTDVHHFIGRVWVFTDDELKSILEKR